LTFTPYYNIIGKIKKGVDMDHKMSFKNYECTKCGLTKRTETNHFGEIYPSCYICNTITVWILTDAVPEGAWIPKPWKIERLGDICQIVQKNPV